ncbi:PstC family ABC transporter permease, partial [Anaerolinea sp.]|uniref:PstC family ABC transporter permease n=1 Tax=Anaerolinea sp. TaxID=1872519 RepID=UPI003A0FCF05
MEVTLNHLKRPEESAVDVSRRLQKRTRWGELFIQTFLFLCGAVSIFTTLGIVYELGKEALLFFQMPGVTLVEFFTQTEWQPTVGRFGVLPLVSATVVTTVIAMLVAVPFGLGSAIYLSEYASEKARKILKPALEVLAGIPTVVYGYFALTTVTPFLRIFFGETLNIYNMLSAGLTMGIMIIPLVASISEDALHAVPNS